MLKQNTYKGTSFGSTLASWVLLVFALFIGANTATAQFAPYCGPLVFSFDVEPITNVTFAGINNTTSAVVNGTPSHENFISITGTVNAGQSYAISVKGNTAGGFTCPVYAYIDWNHDFDFTDAGEFIYIGDLVGSTGTDAQFVSTNIVVPANAYIGTTRMRIYKKFSTALPSPNDGCTGSSYGQAEDYSLLINQGAPPPPPGVDTCYLVCPQNMTLTLDPGACDAYVHYNVQAVGEACELGFSGLDSISQTIPFSPNIDDALIYVSGEVRHYRAYTNATTSPFRIVSAGAASWSGGNIQVFVYTYTGALGGATLNQAQMTLVGQSINAPIGSFRGEEDTTDHAGCDPCGFQLRS